MTESIHFLFFFNDTATTEIYTLSLHDALPICAHGARTRRGRRGGRGAGGGRGPRARGCAVVLAPDRARGGLPGHRDRKSTRLNSSHANISYAVFCLKKKKNTTITTISNSLNIC